MPLRQRQVLIVPLAGPTQRILFDERSGLGVAGGETHVRRLAGGAVVLAQVGNRGLDQAPR